MNLSKAWNAKLEVGIFWRGVIELRQNIEKNQKVVDFLKILFLLQNDRFMEITEAFHPQTPIATPMGVKNVDPDPTGGRGLLHEGRGNPPKRSPNCNGHPASSSIQVYRDGEISFIPLQERGIILHGKPVFI